MPVGGPGPYQLRKLSAELKAAGTQGQGLKRELFKAINQAAKPLAAQVKSGDNLRSHMPDHYAEVLGADLAVTAVKRSGRDAGVSIRAKARAKKRRVGLVDQGILQHPVFGDRDKWVKQASHVQAGFFTDLMKKAAPGIRDQVLQAMSEVSRKLTS